MYGFHTSAHLCMDIEGMPRHEGIPRNEVASFFGAYKGKNVAASMMLQGGVTELGGVLLQQGLAARGVAGVAG